MFLQINHLKSGEIFFPQNFVRFIKQHHRKSKMVTRGLTFSKIWVFQRFNVCFLCQTKNTGTFGGHYTQASLSDKRAWTADNTFSR
jgi:hypothetical protein